MKLERFFELFDRAVAWFELAIIAAAAGLGGYMATVIMQDLDLGWLTYLGVMIGTSLVFALITWIGIWVLKFFH